MRKFAYVESRGAVDFDFGVQCRSTGQVEPQESIEMVTAAFELELTDCDNKQWLQVLYPYFHKSKRINDVLILENIVGREFSTPLERLIGLKRFCSFDGTDFAFIQYIGSGIVNSKMPSEHMKTAAVVDTDALLRAKVDIPKDARRYADDVILLSDSDDQWVPLK